MTNTNRAIRRPGHSARCTLLRSFMRGRAIGSVTSGGRAMLSRRPSPSPRSPSGRSR